MFCGFKANLLLPSYFPIQSLKIVRNTIALSGTAVLFCMRFSTLLVEGLQSIGVSNNASVAKHISEESNVSI